MRAPVRVLREVAAVHKHTPLHGHFRVRSSSGTAVTLRQLRARLSSETSVLSLFPALRGDVFPAYKQNKIKIVFFFSPFCFFFFPLSGDS